MSARATTYPPGLIRLLFAMSASELGDKLVQVAYAIIAVKTGSTTFLAAVLAAQTIPILALTPVVSARGWTHSRMAWRAGLIGQVVSFAAAVVLSGSPIAILVCILVASACETLTMPFSRSLLHTLSDGRHAELAKLWGIAKAGAGAGGMVLAGLVISLSGAGLAFLLNAMTFLFVLVVAWSPRVPEAGTTSRHRPASGIRHLLAPGAFGIGGLVCVVMMLLATSLEGVFGPFMLAKTPGFDARGLGVVMACWAIASMITAAVVPKKISGVRAFLPLSNILVALALGLPSLGFPFWLAAVTFAIGGIGNGIFNLLLSRVIWSGVSAAGQADAWSAFNWILNALIFLSFLVAFFLRPPHAPTLLAFVSALGLVAGGGYLAIVLRSPETESAVV